MWSFFPHDVYGFQSDHQLVWADICNEYLLGHRPQHIYHALLSKTRSNDPDTCEKYIQRCLEKYGCEDVINDFQTLTSFCQRQQEGEDLRNEIIHLHSSLATKIERIQLEVDKSLGRFFIGLVPWSSTLQVHCDCIDYWYHVLHIKIGALISKNIIKKLSIKLSEYSGHYLTSLLCLDKLKIA